MQNIFIIGGGFINKGAEAMTLTVLNQFNKNNTKFLMFKGKATDEQEAYVLNPETDKIKLVNHLGKKLLLLGGMLPLSLAKLFLGNENKKKIENLSKLDTLIDISGFFLTTKFGKRMWFAVLKRFLLVKLMKKLKVKYFILPQAMGPFDEWKLRFLSKKILKLADLIIVRDEKALGYVKELGLKKEINLLPDIAFLFERKELVEIKERRKKNDSKLVIAIAPNMRVYERFFDRNGNNRYLEILSTFIKELPDYSEVILVPHEIKDNGGKDDVFLCNELKKQGILEKFQKAYIVKKKTAKEIKEVISGADIVIASRFHTAVGALSCGIPTMTIGWADKYPELLKLFDLEEFALDYRQLSTENIKSKFKKLLENRNEIARKIEEKLPKIIEKANKVFELVEKEMESSDQ